jgi:hypothetical protein
MENRREGAPREAAADGRAEVPSPAARRALAEAEARRRLAGQNTPVRPREIAGRDGPEPTRFGDWEVKGIVSDF